MRNQMASIGINQLEETYLLGSQELAQGWAPFYLKLRLQQEKIGQGWMATNTCKSSLSGCGKNGIVFYKYDFIKRIWGLIIRWLQKDVLIVATQVWSWL